MALNYVILVFTEQDAGNSPSAGAVTIAPTSAVVAAGQTVVSAQPVSRQLGSGTVSVSLVATDNAGTTPAAGFWAYTITLPGGQPQVYLLPFSGGATQQFSNLTPAVASVTYGPAASGGFTNPMTALGDIMYENATPAAARLAGDTSNTRKFLRTQASGGVAQAPAWDTIAAGDLPAATTSVQGAVILDGTAADIQPDGVQAAGSKGQAADAKHVHPFQPWQFLPEAYGAKGDGKIITDLVLNGSTTATSATAGFTSADTGKKIMINGAIGATNIPLITTITFVNATTITLGSAASVSGSAFQGVYGTDDTAAINSAISAAKAYALANNYFAEIVFGAKIYVLSSGPTQTTTPAVQNSQIQIPFPNVSGSTQKLAIALTGAGDNGWREYWESITPNVAGTALVSMTTAPSTPSGTYGQQSVIGGPSAGGAFTGGFANTRVAVRGIQVVCPLYTNQYCLDFGYVSSMRVQQCSARAFAPAGYGGGNSPLMKDQLGVLGSYIGAGLRSPVNGNNADVVVDDFAVEGISRALFLFDHATCTKIATIYNDVALYIDPSQGNGNNTHGIFIGLFSCEQYNGGISVLGGGGGIIPVYINMDSECPASPVYDINDTGNALYGQIRWTDPVAVRAPVVNGASHLKVVNDKLGAGQWTGAMTPAVPAVPATTVAQKNTSYRDATVYLTSGGAAVTAIAVDSVTTGLTLGTSGTVAVRVPSGRSITLTYASTAPTWVWVLD
jgi:hypothetical protein